MFINLIVEKIFNFYINKNNIKKFDENNYIHYISINDIIQNIKKKNFNFSNYSYQLLRFYKIYTSKSELKEKKRSAIPSSIWN